VPDGPLTTIHDGVLEKIFVCELDGNSMWQLLRNPTLLLALMAPFKTDAALYTTFYKPSQSNVDHDR
jgi:hypothetical protein